MLEGLPCSEIVQKCLPFFPNYFVVFSFYIKVCVPSVIYFKFRGMESIFFPGFPLFVHHVFNKTYIIC